MSLLCEAPGCRRLEYHVAGCPGAAHCRGCSPHVVAPGFRLCWPHLGHIGADALGAAEMWHDLLEVLSGGSGGLSDVVTGTRDRQAVNASAIDARTEIMHTLTSWCKLIIDERQRWPVGDDIDSKAKLISDSAQWLAAHELAGECSAELRSLAWGRPRAIAFRLGARTRPVGLCPVNGCNGEVRAALRRPDSLRASEIRCAVDASHIWQPHEWAALATLHERPDLTTDEAALMLGVGTESVYQFVARRRLASLGGRPAKYRYADVDALRREIWQAA